MSNRFLERAGLRKDLDLRVSFTDTQPRQLVAEPFSRPCARWPGAQRSYSRAAADASAPARMQSWHTSPTGIALIKEFEGFRARLYNDPANHCTIGYGTLVHKGPIDGRASETPYQNGIDVDQATALLRQALGAFEGVINEAVQVELLQHQFDALASFVYNVGPTNFRNSTLLAKLNAGDYAAVPEQLRRWVFAGGTVLAGLARRRAAEAALWADGGYASTQSDETEATPAAAPPPTAAATTLVWPDLTQDAACRSLVETLAKSEVTAASAALLSGLKAVPLQGHRSPAGFPAIIIDVDSKKCAVHLPDEMDATYSMSKPAAVYAALHIREALRKLLPTWKGSHADFFVAANAALKAKVTTFLRSKSARLIGGHKLETLLSKKNAFPDLATKFTIAGSSVELREDYRKGFEDLGVGHNEPAVAVRGVGYPYVAYALAQGNFLDLDGATPIGVWLSTFGDGVATIKVANEGKTAGSASTVRKYGAWWTALVTGVAAGAADLTDWNFVKLNESRLSPSATLCKVGHHNVCYSEAIWMRLDQRSVVVVFQDLWRSEAASTSNKILPPVAQAFRDALAKL